jgi:hypothetical protein
MAKPGTEIDIVGAKTGAYEFLEEVAFFVCRF